jgi:hypothetical protein
VSMQHCVSGGQHETVPRGEEVGEGPGPTSRRRPAGNGPAASHVRVAPNRREGADRWAPAIVLGGTGSK